MPVRARFTGQSRVRRVLARIPGEFRAEIAGAIDRTARRIVERAQALVPKDTGTLRDAMDYRVAKNGLSATLGIRRRKARRDAFYGHFVEFGTVHQPARPFLTPAFEEAKPEGVADIKAAVRSALIRSTRAAGGPD